MGTDGCYTFRWSQPAEKVFVTGTFNNWARTLRLDRKGDIFEKEVQLPITDDKIVYKFIVDGTWTTDKDAREEEDSDHNVNNVLLPEDIERASPSLIRRLSAALMAGVTPESTTAALAAQVPKESDNTSQGQANGNLPGTFPETPANEAEQFKVNPIPASSGIGNPTSAEPDQISKDAEQFSVSPIPASTGVGNPITLNPGEKVPQDVSANTVESTVRTDKEAYEGDVSSPVIPELKEGEARQFSVNPIPASTGVGNPITLKPGEKVPLPADITANTVESTVRTDKEAYEGDVSSPVIPGPKEGEARQFSVNPIPASTGVGNPITLRPGEKVPQDVSANTVESTVRTDKEAYEGDVSAPIAPGAAPIRSESDEAGEKIPPVSADLESMANDSVIPPVSTGLTPEASLPEGRRLTDTGVTIQSAAPTATATELAAAVPLEKNAKDKAPASETARTQGDTGVTIQSAAPAATATELAAAVPLEKHAQDKTLAPETAATPSDNDVTIQSAAPAATATELAAAVPLEKHAKNTETGATQGSTDVEVPGIVKKSLREAHKDPEAAGYPEVVEEKKELEQEILQKVPPSESAGTPGHTTTAVNVATAPAPTGDAASVRDTESKPQTTGPQATGATTGPLVTTGIAEAKTSEVSEGIAAPAAQDQAKETAAKGPPSTAPAAAAAAAAVTASQTRDPRPEIPSSKAQENKGDEHATNGNHAETREKKKKHGFFSKLKEKFKA
ncbi:hypothetical protein MAP00_002241 [Monascus purpureus]|nr:hypothetical protein MAP00_002241 [Monascus purpureus]